MEVPFFVLFLPMHAEFPRMSNLQLYLLTSTSNSSWGQFKGCVDILILVFLLSLKFSIFSRNNMMLLPLILYVVKNVLVEGGCRRD